MLERIRSRRGEAERGQALAELAIATMLLLVLSLAVFDLGRGLSAYLAIIHGARDGARVAMDSGSTDDQVEAAALAGASPYNASVSIMRTGSSVTVTLTYNYEPITPFLDLMGSGGSLPVSARMVSQ